MAKAPQNRRRTEPAEVDQVLLDLASSLLAEYFFDPENEARYLELYPSRRSRPGDPPLVEETLQRDGKALEWRVDVLGHRNSFRVAMRHQAFSADVEGIWQFQQETFRQGRVMRRTGNPGRTAAAAGAMLQALAGGEPTGEELADLLAALSDDLEAPLIGDDPEEPPPATSTERARARALVERLRSRPDSEPRNRGPDVARDDAADSAGAHRSTG